MENKWIEENVDSNGENTYISCGHNRFGDYSIPIRDYDPSLYLTLCTACYQRMLGFFLDEIRTIKFDKLRV